MLSALMVVYGLLNIGLRPVNEPAKIIDKWQRFKLYTNYKLNLEANQKQQFSAQKQPTYVNC